MKKYTDKKTNQNFIHNTEKKIKQLHWKITPYNKNECIKVSRLALM